MNFLSPWFLLGALAVAGPVIFHLIRRAARERTPFSSLMFLKPTPPRTVRRRKLENIFLLLLRCLCLLLVATAFARPFFHSTLPPVEPATGGRQIVLLLDTSASMKRSGVWEKARAVAESYLKKAEAADQFAVITFDRQPHTLVGISEWSSWAADERASQSRQRLAEISPGWMGTQLGLALTTAAEQFQTATAGTAPPKSRAVVLITDLQEGAKLDGLQGHDWPTDVRVVIERVEGGKESNAGLEILEPSGAAGAANGVSVRIANSGNSTKEKFRLGWNGGASTEIYLPPGQSRNFTAPKLPGGTTSGKLELSGDDLAFDNVSYFAAPEIENLAVAFLGTDAAEDPNGLRYYLQRVFPPTPRRRVEIVSDDSLSRAAFAFISGNFPTEKIPATRDWIAGGKSALVVLNNISAASKLAALLGVPEVRLTEAGGNFALLGQIDFKHPVFAPFDDPRFSDFSHIHFWKHRRWEIPTTLKADELAKFDDGSPALVQVAVGKGQLLVLASGWNPADSQLAVASKFPPLMQTMLEWSGSAAPAHFQFRTGDAIPAPLASAATVVWQKPDGKKVSLPAGKPFVETDVPGIYQVAWENSRRQFAVNLPVEESRVAPMPVDELARLGVPLGTSIEAASAPTLSQRRELQRSELESHQKIWRWLLAAALGIALVEIIVGGWLARRPPQPEPAS